MADRSWIIVKLGCWCGAMSRVRRKQIDHGWYCISKLKRVHEGALPEICFACVRPCAGQIFRSCFLQSLLCKGEIFRSCLLQFLLCQFNDTYHSNSCEILSETQNFHQHIWPHCGHQHPPIEIARAEEHLLIVNLFVTTTDACRVKIFFKYT